MKHVIVISPHIDDAIYSLGGLLAQLKDSSLKITVLNIFSSSNFTKEGSGEKKYVTSLRQNEDRVALSNIAYEIINLDFDEALLRGYQIENLFTYGGNPYQEFSILLEKKLVELISYRIKQYIQDGDILFVPSGFGGHIDHLIARSSCDDLTGNIVRYGDLPYIGRNINNCNGLSFLADKLKYDIHLSSKAYICHIELMKNYYSQYKDKYDQSILEYLTLNGYKLRCKYEKSRVELSLLIDDLIIKH